MPPLETTGYLEKGENPLCIAQPQPLTVDKKPPLNEQPPLSPGHHPPPFVTTQGSHLFGERTVGAGGLTCLSSADLWHRVSLA